MEMKSEVDLKGHWKGREGGSRKVRRLSVKRNWSERVVGLERHWKRKEGGSGKVWKKVM